VSAPYAVHCELELWPSDHNGLNEPMPVPTPSLLLVFTNLDPEETQREVQIGAMISGPPVLVPGTVVEAQLSFWDDIGRIYATPGADFGIWYAGRIVGSGAVVAEITQAGP
jgi:hypothetical protein